MIGLFGGHEIDDKVNLMRHSPQHICMFGCALQWLCEAALRPQNRWCEQAGSSRYWLSRPALLHSPHTSDQPLSLSSGTSSRHMLLQRSAAPYHRMVLNNGQRQSSHLPYIGQKSKVGSVPKTSELPT